MIGAEPPPLEHRDRTRRAPWCCEVDGLTLARDDPFGVDLEDIALEVRAGEVVGIAGVSGNGQRELLYALSGEDTRAAPDAVQRRRPAGRAAWARRSAARLGLHFVPEERLGRGAVPTLGLAHNLLLTRTDAVGPQRLDRRQGACSAQAPDIIRRFNVKAGGPRRGGALAVGRQPAEIHRRPRDRRQPEAADRVAADLGRGRGRRRADPRRDPGAARRRLRRAGGQRGAGGTVRDQRPPARDRQGPAVALARARRRRRSSRSASG